MRSLESPTHTGRGAEPHTVTRLGALSVQLVDSDEQVRNRDAYFRRLLATADVLAAGIALIVATSFGGDGDRLALAAVLALTVFVILAKLLGLDKRFRLNIVPISIGFPFGVSVIMPPNVPLPTKIVVQVLEPIDIAAKFGADPDVNEVDRYVRSVMQEALDALAADRRFPIIG